MYYVNFIKSLMRDYVVENDYTKEKRYSKEDILNFEINAYFDLYYLQTLKSNGFFFVTNDA